MRFLRLLFIVTFVASASISQSVKPAHAANALPYYHLPWDAGLSITVSQGNNSSFSHICPGTDCYAWDFPGNGLNVRAARGGTVTGIVDGWGVGGCDQNNIPKTNYVKIDSGDGYESVYLHLASGLSVAINDLVPTKTKVIGLMGASGFTCNGANPPGPGFHLHYQVEPSCATVMECYSVPSSFLDASVLSLRADGVPLTGDSVIPDNVGPSISNISQAGGPAGGGTSIDITGTGFQGVTGPAGVQFGGTNAASYQVKSDKLITAVSPPFAPVAADITVTNNGMTSALSSADMFTYGPCASPGLTLDKPSPQQADTTVTFSATSTTCPKPQYEFWVQPPGGGWYLQRGYGASTWAWDTTTWAPGAYNVNVWVREFGSSADPERNLIIPYTLNLKQPCVSPGLSADVGSPQQQDKAVTFYATSTTCPKPQYEFWLQPPGQGWYMQRAYGTSTWTWDTSTSPPGTYAVNVWVREVGSSSDPETNLIIAYTLTFRQPCTSPWLTPDQSSPRQQDSAITFYATSATCPKPQYEFWLQPPGQGWYLQRAYGASTWTWDTSTSAPGTYNVNVWVREVGSSSDPETNWIVPYSLVIRQPCASAGLTADPSPQQIDSAVTFYATSATCPKPEYLFYLLPPGGTWTIARGWAGPIWTWDTSGVASVGTYSVNVWVREVGTGGTNPQTNHVIPYTLTNRQACASEGLTPDQVPPQVRGTGLTFSAFSTTCPKPEYEFYLQAPGQGWSLVQGYGGSTWTWDTSGVTVVGTYTVDVWIREVGSAGSYQAFQLITYTVT